MLPIHLATSHEPFQVTSFFHQSSRQLYSKMLWFMYLSMFHAVLHGLQSCCMLCGKSLIQLWTPNIVERVIPQLTFRFYQILLFLHLASWYTHRIVLTFNFECRFFPSSFKKIFFCLYSFFIYLHFHHHSLVTHLLFLGFSFHNY